MPSLIGRCGGGGAISEYWGTYTSDVSGAITNGQAFLVTWDNHIAGQGVLDVASPASPTVTKTGNWAVTVVGGPAENTTSGSDCRMDLLMGSDAFAEGQSGGASATFPSPDLTLTCVTWLSLGDVIQVFLINGDAVARSMQMNQATVTFLGGS